MNIALVLGFCHEGRVGAPEKGRIRDIAPGLANEILARRAFELRNRFPLILTQAAVSQVWINEGRLRLHDGDILTEKGECPSAKADNTAVFQMHRDEEDTNVRTLAALRLATERVGGEADQIVLIAHRDHVRRAALDLQVLWQGKFQLEAPTSEYPSSMSPAKWQRREKLATVIEAVRRTMKRYGAQQQKLPPIPRRPPGGWEPEWCGICNRFLGLLPPFACAACLKPLCGSNECGSDEFHHSEYPDNSGWEYLCAACRARSL